jgi:hypothetical protein
MSQEKNQTLEIVCVICCEDMDETNTPWLDSNFKSSTIFCLDCLKYMIKNNFSRYIQDIAKADCEKSLGSALTDPIPMYVTKDTLKKSEQITEVYLSNEILEVLDCKLLKPIDDIILNKLNNQFNKIKLQMDNEPTFDYLGEITRILKSYNLDNIDI